MAFYIFLIYIIRLGIFLQEAQDYDYRK